MPTPTPSPSLTPTPTPSPTLTPTPTPTPSLDDPRYTAWATGTELGKDRVRRLHNLGYL